MHNTVTDKNNLLKDLECFMKLFKFERVILDKRELDDQTEEEKDLCDIDNME